MTAASASPLGHPERQDARHDPHHTRRHRPFGQHRPRHALLRRRRRICPRPLRAPAAGRARGHRVRPDLDRRRELREQRRDRTREPAGDPCLRAFPAPRLPGWRPRPPRAPPPRSAGGAGPHRSGLPRNRRRRHRDRARPASRLSRRAPALGTRLVLRGPARLRGDLRHPPGPPRDLPRDAGQAWAPRHLQGSEGRVLRDRRTRGAPPLLHPRRSPRRRSARLHHPLRRGPLPRHGAGGRRHVQ